MSLRTRVWIGRAMGITGAGIFLLGLFIAGAKLIQMIVESWGSVLYFSLLNVVLGVLLMLTAAWIAGPDFDRDPLPDYDPDDDPDYVEPGAAH